jgi:multiple sugar transport system permease protein
MMSRSQKNSLVFHFFVVLFGLFMTYPLLWMLSASFKTNAEIFTGVNFFPKNPSFGNFINGFKGVSGYTFGRFLWNSFFIAFLCIFGNILSCSMAAFAFSKLKFKLNVFLFSIMMLTLMLPFHVKLIPQYVVYNTIGWVNTFFPLIVPKFFATEGFFVFLLVQYMRAMSNELLEAPRIDGCNTFQIFTMFIMPLSVPALVTVSIFTFIWTWNDFFSQTIYLSDPAKFTVSLALRMFVDATGQSSWGSLFAMSCLSLVPLFVIFVVFQRYLIEGITSGSLKG